MYRARVMVGRLATTVIPAVAIGVTAVVLLGPGRPHDAVAVRVFGLPWEGGGKEGGAVAWRVVGVRRLFGVDDAVALKRVRLEASDEAGKVGEWGGSLGPDGVAEAVVRLARPLRGGVQLRVTQGEAVLAEGRVSFARREGSAAAGEPVPGSARGDVSVSVEVVRGVLVAPFEDAIRVSIQGQGEAMERVAIEARAEGADVRPARSGVDQRGRAAFWVKPHAHLVELTVEVTAGEGKSGRWEGILPVVPGGMWLEPAQGDRALEELRIVSASPRRRAYLSVVGDEGRVFGAAFPLEPDGAGFFAGRVRLDGAASGARRREVILAGDAFEQGAGTVAWPLVPPEGTAAVRRVELLLDGMPGAEAQERARAWAARRAAVMVVGAAAMLEVLLLVLMSRASQRALEEHLVRASGAEDGASRPMSTLDRATLLASARHHPVLSLLAATSLVGLAFSLVLALATLR